MESTEKRRRGRPPTGVTPKRNIRVGPIWDKATDLAAACGETMTALVTRAIEREVHRLERAQRRSGSTHTGTPHNRPPADYIPYGERKPYTVADSLDDLAGPTSGVVTLPHHIDWSGSSTFDLDRSARLASMYKAVLAEASSVDDLNTWLNRDRLIALWPDLYLPPKVRRLWEDRFPELATIAQPLSR